MSKVNRLRTLRRRKFPDLSPWQLVPYLPTVISLAAVTVSLVVSAFPGVRLTEGAFRSLTLALLVGASISLLAVRMRLEIAESEKDGGYIILKDHVTTYTEASRVLRAGMPEGRREIRATVLYPQEEESHLTPAVTLYQEAFFARVLSQPEFWKVRHLYCFTNLSRFDQIVDRLRTLDAAPNYEVKAYVGNIPFTTISPLIIGDTVLLGMQDKRHLRTEQAVMMSGESIQGWAIEYFQRLWDSAPFELRPQRGLDAQQVTRARTELERVVRRTRR